jgi:Glycosyltransferase 61
MMMTTRSAQQKRRRQHTGRGLFFRRGCGTIHMMLVGLMALLCALGNLYVLKRHLTSNNGDGGSCFLALLWNGGATAGSGASSFQAGRTPPLDEGYQGMMASMLASFKKQEQAPVMKRGSNNERVSDVALQLRPSSKTNPAITTGVQTTGASAQQQQQQHHHAIRAAVVVGAALQQQQPPASLSNTAPVEEESINTFTFPRHGCFVNTGGGGSSSDDTHRIHCHFRNLRIDTSKISAGHWGGEALHTVMGAAEETEFLSYQKGAFVLQSPLEPPAYPLDGNFWYMNDVHNAISYDSATTASVEHDHNNNNNNTTIALSSCDQVWTGLTLFLTRYEYVNLYHTMTDWWNAFYSLPIATRLTSNNTTSLENREKVNVVFLDAHPQGNLDPVWRQLFGGNVSFVRHLPKKMTCFEEARFVPAGYSSPVFPRQRNAVLTDRDHAGAFVERMLNAYDLNHVHRIPGHVVVIDRVPYIAHPRSKPETTQRLLGNMRELALNLPSLLSLKNVTVQVVTLVNDTMREQIAAIRRAHVLIANHGAGLTHLLFLDSGAHVVELNCRHQFFPELSKWRRRDIQHHCQGQSSEEGSISTSYWEQNVASVVKHAVL